MARETFELQLGHAGLMSEDKQRASEYVHRAASRPLTVLDRFTTNRDRRWFGRHVPASKYVEAADDQGFTYLIFDQPPAPVARVESSYGAPRYNGAEPTTAIMVASLGINPASFRANDQFLKAGSRYVLWHDHGFFFLLNTEER